MPYHFSSYDQSCQWRLYETLQLLVVKIQSGKLKLFFVRIPLSLTSQEIKFINLLGFDMK